MIRCSEAFRAIRFNRVAILRYTQGAWILTRGELVVTSLRSELAALGMCCLRAGARTLCWWSYGLGAGCMMVSSVVVTSPTGVTASASIVCVRRSRPSRTGTGEAGAGGR